MTPSLPMTTPPPPTPTPLAARLRDETLALHRQVERAGLMAELLRGRLPRERYAALLRNLHAIYAALEAALDAHADHPAVAPLRWPVLFRCEALALDLAALHGSGWADALPLAAATRAYVARLQRLAQTEPPRLAAHAYVRYLGDLNGGQLLRRTVARAYGLAGDTGTRFYDFGPEAGVPALQAQFRNGLASLAPAPAEADTLVAEARWAYEQHGRLFEELAAPAPASLGTRPGPP